MSAPQPSRSARRLAVAAALLAQACSAPPSSVPGSSSAATSGAASASASATTSAEVAAAAATSRLWEQARDGDGAALDALARAEGAAGLARALGDPARAPTARAALLLAPDGELALDALAARLSGDGADAEAAGETLLAVLERPSSAGERLDPEGDDHAEEVLLALAKDERRPARQRALAISALRRLAARGRLDASTIPSALDED